jgi:hypothetical protein
VGLRSDQPEPDAADPDQIGLFDGLACRYRVFVTNMDSGQWSPVESSGVQRRWWRSTTSGRRWRT